MTRLGTLAAVLIAAATGALSKEVTVRSGEHDGFTRLVVNVPPDTGWTLAQRKNGARLTLALDEVTFHTDSVFSRLTTERLDSVSQVRPGSPLELEFGCDCVASAFLFQNKMIVLDIAPGKFLPPVIAGLPPPVFGQGAPQQALRKTPDPISQLDLPLLNLNRQGFVDQLSARLLQGADRDILDLNLATMGPRTSFARESVAVPYEPGANVNLSSILDELPGLLGASLLQIDTEPACIPDADLGLANWSDGRPFPVQASALRAGLFQEFDRVDEARALKLAKLYAFHGFGAEAIRVLDLLQDPAQETQWISTIARIVDEQTVTGQFPFSGLQKCEGDVALWAALAEQALAPDARVEAIEQSFARLPDHLRRNLGARLATILVDGQQTEAARRILRSVDRLGGEPRPTVQQVKAQVAEAEGQDGRAESLLTEVVTSPDAALDAPLALARLVEKRWVDRGSVSAQELGLAAAYATEYRRSELAAMTARTHAIALGLGQEFDQAFDLINALPKDADFPGTLNRHLQVLAERSDDITFLRQAFAVLADFPDELSTDAAVALSDRLAALGFPAQAFDLANRQQDRVRRFERARLRARAAISNNRPHQAMLELADDPSEHAARLRVQAMAAAGDYAGAGDLLLGLGDTQAADRYFWLTDLPERVGAEGKYAVLTETTQALSEPPIRLPDTPLADAAGLLEDSRKTRQRISGLFADIQQQ